MSFVSNICPIKIESKPYYEHAKELSFKFQLLKAAKSGKFVHENEVNKLNNLKYARKVNGQITIQEIFKNHWPEFLDIQKAKGKSIRQSILKNVEKMIHCKDLSKGYLFFECPKCNNFHIQGHPAMSESRILSYDKDKSIIYYYYDPHEDDAILNDSDKIGRQYVCESVFKFMKKLVRHIPNKGFHNIRYYGFYSKRSTIDTSSIRPLYSTSELNKIKQNINWNKKMKLTYGYEPLLCSCGKRLEFCPELSFFPPPNLDDDDFDLYEELSNKLIDYPERKIDIEKPLIYYLILKKEKL